MAAESKIPQRARADIALSWFEAEDDATRRALHALQTQYARYDSEGSNSGGDWVDEVTQHRLRFVITLLSLHDAVLHDTRVAQLLSPQVALYHGWGLESNHISLAWLSRAFYHTEWFLSRVTQLESDPPEDHLNQRKRLVKSHVLGEWVKVLEVEIPRVVAEWGPRFPAKLNIFTDPQSKRLLWTRQTLKAYGWWNAYMILRENAPPSADEDRTVVRSTRERIQAMTAHRAHHRRLFELLFRATALLNTVGGTWKTHSAPHTQIKLHATNLKALHRLKCPLDTVERERQRARRAQESYEEKVDPKQPGLEVTGTESSWAQRVPVEMLYQLTRYLQCRNEIGLAITAADLCAQCGGEVDGLGRALERVFGTVSALFPTVVCATFADLLKKRPELVIPSPTHDPPPAAQFSYTPPAWKLRTLD